MPNLTENALKLNNPLWQFACDRYTDEIVQRSLLSLQDNNACHINLLLCLAWADELGYALELSDIQRLEAACIDTQRVLLPLRQARRIAKNFPLIKDSVQSLLASEVEIERKEIALLFAVVNNMRHLDKRNSNSLNMYLKSKRLVDTPAAHHLTHQLAAIAKRSHHG